MGKRYYCDYCNKTMVNSPSIIRTHNKGVVHQKLVSEHYQLYKDPETILKEESVKKPCSRFLQGQCQFGGICRYSHYTPEQLQELQAYVLMKDVPEPEPERPQPSFRDFYYEVINDKTNSRKNKSTLSFETNDVEHTFLWTYNPLLDKIEDLPPSIKRFKESDFKDAFIANWG